MDQKTRDFVTEQTKALMAAPSCCAEAKAAAQAWLAAAAEAQVTPAQATVVRLGKQLVAAAQPALLVALEAAATACPA